jgi:putative flippase GtrA
MFARLWERFRSLFWFCVAGVLALFVDIGVLYALKPWLGLYLARACSFWAAATFTWLFNRSITFEGPKPGSVLREYLTYLLSMLGGGAVNYLSYAVAIQTLETVRNQPAWGVALGSLSGLTVNFVSARWILQKRA